MGVIKKVTIVLFFVTVYLVLSHVQEQDRQIRRLSYENSKCNLRVIELEEFKIKACEPINVDQFKKKIKELEKEADWRKAALEEYIDKYDRLYYNWSEVKRYIKSEMPSAEKEFNDTSEQYQYGRYIELFYINLMLLEDPVTE